MRQPRHTSFYFPKLFSYPLPVTPADLACAFRKWKWQTDERKAYLKLEKALGIDYQCFFYQVQTNYEIYIATNHLSEQSHPDKAKFRKALFWDTDFEVIDWQRNSEWIIQRVFEYGNEIEIKETIRFYGKRKIAKVLDGIKDSWNSENRNKNIQKYLGHEIEN